MLEAELTAMSARVFNPMVMSEMRRILRAYGENGPRHNVASTPGTEDLDRVRRDLFGPVDHDETRRFVESELVAQHNRDADRWGFNFVRESPRKTGPGTTRYAWQKVPTTETVPEPYALRRLQCLRQATVTVQNEKDDSKKQKNMNLPVETVPQETASKQTRITDYMKGRKRTFNSTTSTKSPSAPSPPAKQARTTPS